MRKLTTVPFLALILGLGASSASADTITFNLNCTFATPNGCDASPLYGTVSLSDTATDGEFSILVDLVGSGVHKVQKLFLNFVPAVAGFTFDTANADGIQVTQNGRQADGYTGGFFDLEIPDPPPGNLGFEPYSNTIIITGAGIEGLSVQDFNTKDSQGLLFAAVHIGNIGASFTPGSPGEESIWVGSRDFPSTDVPEPGLLLFLGAGLLGVSVAARKRSRV